MKALSTEALKNLLDEFLKDPSVSISAKNELADYVADQINVIKCLDKKNYIQAFDSQTALIEKLKKLLDPSKLNHLSHPVFYRITYASTALFRMAAMLADKHSPNTQKKPCEDAANSLTTIIRTVNDPVIQLIVGNLVIKMHFKFAPMLLKPTLTKLNDLGEYIERAPISQNVTFQFLYGKYLLIVGDYNEALTALETAFTKCPSNHRNKRTCFFYLSIAKLLCGIIPSTIALQEYNFPLIHQISHALRSGNVGEFSRAMEQHKEMLCSKSVYMCLMKLKILVIKRLFKKVYLMFIGDKNVLPIKLFVKALEISGETFSEAEVIGLFMVLKRKKYVKAQKHPSNDNFILFPKKIHGPPIENRKPVVAFLSKNSVRW